MKSKLLNTTVWIRVERKGQLPTYCPGVVTTFINEELVEVETYDPYGKPFHLTVSWAEVVDMQDEVCLGTKTY